MRELALNKNHIAIIDDEDYDYLSQWKWHLSAGGYVVRGVYDVTGNIAKQRILYMHRELLNCPDKLFVDHINHIRTDNRRSNLRIATASQNAVHRKGGKRGITYHKQNKKWIAAIHKDNRRIYIGSYLTEQEAYDAYDVVALELHGEFAVLNRHNT